MEQCQASRSTPLPRHLPQWSDLHRLKTKVTKLGRSLLLFSTTCRTVAPLDALTCWILECNDIMQLAVQTAGFCVLIDCASLIVPRHPPIEH